MLPLCSIHRYNHSAFNAGLLTRTNMSFVLGTYVLLRISMYTRHSYVYMQTNTVLRMQWPFMKMTSIVCKQWLRTLENNDLEVLHVMLCKKLQYILHSTSTWFAFEVLYRDSRWRVVQKSSWSIHTWRTVLWWYMKQCIKSSGCWIGNDIYALTTGEVEHYSTCHSQDDSFLNE